MGRKASRRPARKQFDPQQEPDPLVEVGVTGLEQYSGRIHEEFLPKLYGRKATRIYKEMADNDPIVGSMLFAIGMLVRQVEWRVEPVSSQPVDVEIAEFVDSCFHDLHGTWDETLGEILSMLWCGYSLLEEVYKYRRGPAERSLSSRHRDGRIGWRKLAPRAQETIENWHFDEESGQEVVGLRQMALPDYVPRDIPMTRILHFRTLSHKDNPEGRSLLRNAYRPWYFKKHIEEIEGIGIERDLAGLPIAYVPPALLSKSASAEEKALLSQIHAVLRNVRRDEKEGVVFPLARDSDGNELYRFSLLTSGGRRNFDTNAVINRYDRRIAQTVLADFLLLGQEGRTGSYALADSKTDLFAVAIGAILDAITQTFNRHAIPRLLSLNPFGEVEAPQLVHGDIEKIDLAKLGAYCVQLAQSGIPLSDPATERYLRMQAGLPEPEEDGFGDLEGLDEEDEGAAGLETIED